jgi:hypothetical protein
MKIIRLTERFDIVADESTDGVWDAFLHDDRDKREPMAMGDGDCMESAIAALFINFSGSSLTLPADAFVPFRARFLTAVHAVGDKAAKRCKVKL